MKVSDVSSKTLLLSLSVILLYDGFIFLQSGYGKITGGKFVEGLAAVLSKFASKNPYPWYKSFLEQVAIPNSNLFASLTMWGELLSGLAIVAGGLYLIFIRNVNKLILSIILLGLGGSIILNGTFWLAAGWTSPSVDSLNMLMLIIELVTFVIIFKLFSRR
ncbi:hypothetical protein HYS93_04125 [Candidatus Daviesbacteria bacterium]|nr:hypothetical protein [Candidatus Daviesbacteria bacterium]